MGDVPGTKVWVGNLGSTCEERDLRDEFSKFGELNKVMTNHTSGPQNARQTLGSGTETRRVPGVGASKPALQLPSRVIANCLRALHKPPLFSFCAGRVEELRAEKPRWPLESEGPSEGPISFHD